MQEKIPNDKRDLPYGSAFAISDSDTSKIVNSSLNLSCLNDNNIVDDFLKLHRKWVSTSKLNTVIGLDNFNYQCYSNGTSEGFDKFYLRNKHRRFRCFNGEYLYHKLAWRDGFNWEYITDLDIDDNDAVVISLPFADTGNCHVQYRDLLSKCDRLGVPVLVDCAYFGICRNTQFDFSYSCITDIMFSLSKTFPVANARIGVRYSRKDTDDTLFVYKKIDYVNRIGAYLGTRFLKNFSPDYIPNKYKTMQKDFCEELNVTASSTVLFGIAETGWPEYNRGGDTSRLSFHKQYSESQKGM